ncbi:MAG: HAD family hydrolase [Armatimonadota bacterium]
MNAPDDSRTIRYVWFDQDDTLYSYHDAMHRALRTCLDIIHGRFPATRETLGVAEMIQVRSDIADRVERAGMDFVQARREAFRETLGRYARLESGLDEALTDAYYDALHTRVWPFPETEQCLRELAGDRLLGVLSNGMSLLGELGIEGFFEHTIYALELGLYKPDPAIFGHAMSLAGAESGECLLVGDNRICDVVGARDAGWTAVWLNRDGRLWDIDAEPPELVITSLAELPPMIAELNST